MDYVPYSTAEILLSTILGVVFVSNRQAVAFILKGAMKKD